jgi:hypothetical protein
MARFPRRTSLALALAVCASFVTRGQTPRPATIIEFLDRYAAGQFDAVVEELAGELNFGDLLVQLRRDGPKWIDAAGPEAREQRELVAVTLALEAARADEWHEWKWIWMPPKMTVPVAQSAPGGAPPGVQGAPPLGGGPDYQPPPVLYWRPAPLFIEWACERLRRDKTPRPIERWWQLAALAVAQRSEDVHFLVGDPNIGRGFDPFGEIGNLQDEIKHLDHVYDRFPQEPRFLLGQGIAREQQWPEEGFKAFATLRDDPDVGGEATMRVGALHMRESRVDRNRLDRGLELFERVEGLTRDPYVIYLARFFTGQIMERQRRLGDAMDAYRRATAAWPHAQAATMSLASRLFDTGRRVEAQTLAGGMLAAKPPPRDPWREFRHADDRFWPQLVGGLRAEIRK